MLTKNSSRFKVFLSRISRHIIPILLLVFIEMSPKFPSLKAADLGIYIVYYIYDIAYFYLITLGFMPMVISWFRRKRLIQEMVAAIAIPFYGILIIFYSAGYTYLLNGKATLFLDYETIQKGSMRGVLICALAYAVAYAREKIRSDKQVSDQKIYSLQLENNILNLQTNPHLINNVLGYLIERIEAYSATDANAILLLSELTSDALGDTDKQGKITIQAEIDYIKKYLTLEALYREKEPFKNIQINLNGQETLPIAPKLLLDPVVNLLKYGNNQKVQNPSSIVINVQEAILHMETYNEKRLSSKISGHHIGIKNLKQRLELNYPGKHILSIEENQTEYRLTLAIELC